MSRRVSAVDKHRERERAKTGARQLTRGVREAIFIAIVKEQLFLGSLDLHGALRRGRERCLTTFALFGTKNNQPSLKCLCFFVCRWMDITA